MNALLKAAIKRLFGRQIAALNVMRTNHKNQRGITSYSQEGEDRVLASLLFKAYGGHTPVTGFYVDVGAHDPFRFSNTYLFYKQGWSGINIDAAPGSMRHFTNHRPRDLNLEIAVGREQASATFYIFNEPALSTFDLGLAKARSITPWRIISEAKVSIWPLRDIFQKYLPENRSLDFMTIDVEGLDLDVLHSNDWGKYRPKIVAIEIFGKSVAEAECDPVATFLKDRSYIFYSKTVNTAFFIDANLP